MANRGRIREGMSTVIRTLVVVLLLASVAFPVTAQEHQGEEAPQSTLCCGNCPTRPGVPNPKHPLQGIRITHSKEVKGPEKDRIVPRVLESPDVQNVLREASLRFHPIRAMVVRHTLDTGNTLLAIGIPTGKGALIYYELAKPLAEPGEQGYKSLYKSQAMLYAVEEKTAKLLSTSVTRASPHASFPIAARREYWG